MPQDSWCRALNRRAMWPIAEWRRQGVVERLEVVEDCELGHVPGVEPAAGLLVEQLVLQGLEHALARALMLL